MCPAKLSEGVTTSGPVLPGVQKSLQLCEFHKAMEFSLLVCSAWIRLEPWNRTVQVSPTGSVRNPWNSSCSLFWAPSQVGTLHTIQSWITALWNKVKRISWSNWNTCGLLSVRALETGLDSSYPWATIQYRLSPQSNPRVLLLAWGNSEPQLLPALLDDDCYKKDSCDAHYASVISGPRSWLLVHTFSTACFLWRMQNHGPGHLQNIIWVRSYYTYPGIFHNNAYFQTDFLPLVREEKLWDFNDSFYWGTWMFIVVLTVKTHRGWNLSREKKAISFTSLHCMGQLQGNISILITICVFLSNSGAQKSANLKKNRMTVESQRWTLRCFFLFDVSPLFSTLLSTYAIVKAIKKNILATQNSRL